jgi:hypothetical protein
MGTSRKYTLAEFTRLVESIKAAKVGGDQFPEKPVPVSDSEFPEDGFANRVVSGMSKFREPR